MEIMTLIPITWEEFHIILKQIPLEKKISSKIEITKKISLNKGCQIWESTSE